MRVCTFATVATTRRRYPFRTGVARLAGHQVFFFSYACACEAAVCGLSPAAARVYSPRDEPGLPPTKIPSRWRSPTPTFVRRAFPAEIPVRPSYTITTYIIYYNRFSFLLKCGPTEGKKNSRVSPCFIESIGNLFLFFVLFISISMWPS